MFFKKGREEGREGDVEKEYEGRKEKKRTKPANQHPHKSVETKEERRNTPQQQQCTRRVNLAIVFGLFFLSSLFRFLFRVAVITVPIGLFFGLSSFFLLTFFLYLYDE